MLKRIGASPVVAIVGLAGVLGLGVAGYSVMTGDCALSACATKAAALTASSGKTCPMSAKAGCATHCSTETAAIATVSDTSDCAVACPEKSGCSTQAAAIATVSDTGSGTGDCAKACSEKSSCTTETVALASDECALSCSEKASCSTEVTEVVLSSFQASFFLTGLPMLMPVAFADLAVAAESCDSAKSCCPLSGQAQARTVAAESESCEKACEASCEGEKACDTPCEEKAGEAQASEPVASRAN